MPSANFIYLLNIYMYKVMYVYIHLTMRTIVAIATKVAASLTRTPCVHTVGSGAL